jgi:F5/8 type C domain
MSFALRTRACCFAPCAGAAGTPHDIGGAAAKSFVLRGTRGNAAPHPTIDKALEEHTMPVSHVLKMICTLCLGACLAACGGGGSSVTVSVPTAPGAPASAPSPTEISYRYVKLEATSEVGGNAFASMAEFNVIDAAGAAYARAGWSATADSEENDLASGFSDYNPAAYAIDGNPQTIWHSAYFPDVSPMPHWVVVDMKAAHAVKGFAYMPRSDGGTNGIIAGFNFYGSNDGSLWTLLISANLNSYPSVGGQKTVPLP